MVSDGAPSGPVPGFDIKPTLTTTMANGRYRRHRAWEAVMTAAPIPTDGTTAGAPVACSLTTEGLAEQAGRWARLAARALTGRALTADGLRLDFHPEPGVEEELRALAAVETQCCPWATWTVQASATPLALDVRATGDGVTALHGMFTGLAAGPGPTEGRPPPAGSPSGDARP